jgi:hypothetical protein
MNALAQNIDERHYRYSFRKGFEKTRGYISLKITKEDFGDETYMTIKTKEGEYVRVYICNYAYLFSHNKITLINEETGKPEKIEVSKVFLPSYINGYLKGKQNFKENFKVSGEVLYGKLSEVFERTLHRHFYHTSFNNFGEGWNYYQRFISSILTPSTLERWGYYAGHIDELNELKISHPIIFSKFNECNKPGEVHENKIPETLKITIQPDIISSIVKSIGYLCNDPNRFEEALKGKSIVEKINFKGQQNQIVELFRRLHIHQKISESKTLTAEWLCNTIRFYDNKNNKFRDLNNKTTYDLLASGKSEPNKFKRICVIPELPYQKPR